MTALLGFSIGVGRLFNFVCTAVQGQLVRSSALAGRGSKKVAPELQSAHFRDSTKRIENLGKSQAAGDALTHAHTTPARHAIEQNF